VIRSFASSETERFFATGKSRRLPPEIRKRVAMRLTQLHAAVTLDDLRFPPSNRLEALKHDRKRAVEHTHQRSMARVLSLRARRCIRCGNYRLSL